MTSLNATKHPSSVYADKRALQRLRREAGFRSARDFAEMVNIPASTYGRYENQPDGPAKAIPLSSAWIIADALGCTIDLVVGREDIDASCTNPFQAAYDALSITGKSLFDEYLAYLQYREIPKARR